MKIAITFLFVALSCYFGTSCANSGKVTNVSQNVPMIPKDCLKKLIRVDVPQTLHRLQELLCMYLQGKKTQNQELFKKFLWALHTTLIDTGCTVDQILSTPQFMEKVGDEAGKVADQLGFELLKTVEELGLGDLVFNTLCKLLGETLKSLSQSLAGLNLAGNPLGIGLLG